MRRYLQLAVFLLVAPPFQGFLSADSKPDLVTLCHRPYTPNAQTMVVLPSAVQLHLNHGDHLGACGQTCTPPAPPEEIDPGTEPWEAEPERISTNGATLEGATETRFNPAGTPITFRLRCPSLQMTPDAVIVYDNGEPVPFEDLSLTPNSVTLIHGVASGRHELRLLGRDSYEYTIQASFVLWTGTASIPVLVLDENGAPVSGAQVVAQLADDSEVTASLSTDAAGRGNFLNLPARSFDLLARTSDNRIATAPTSVPTSMVVLRLQGFEPASSIDNNDFSLGIAGWEIGTAPVTIVAHVESSPSGATASAAAAPIHVGKPTRTAAASAAAAAYLQRATAGTDASDFDLVLNTAGEGQQSISRTFEVEKGTKSVTVRFRFITSEVPGGWFGSQYNDFFNVTLRSSEASGSIHNGNSMNGLGLAAFDSGGATTWYETELPVGDDGDTVQVDIAVANVADGLFDSQVAVDVVKEKTLSIGQLELKDIDNSPLRYLSASNHAYFNGSTRVHGTITIKGPAEDSLEELTVEVLEGGQRIATGTLASSLTGTLLTQFGSDGQIQLSTSQLLFEIPASQLAAADQSVNGGLTIRVKARSSSDERAEKTFGQVTKLVRYTGTNRYGQRDPGLGGDDWAKPGVRVFVPGAGLNWGDFSNMNGGAFPPHGFHRTGNSIDGHFTNYNRRDGLTAATIIGHLNTYGKRITSVFVTFTPAFAGAIANVTLNDGRQAKAVIRDVPGHETHFHWEVSDN